jgi:hypothetical protein
MKYLRQAWRPPPDHHRNRIWRLRRQPIGPRRDGDSACAGVLAADTDCHRLCGGERRRALRGYQSTVSAWLLAEPMASAAPPNVWVGLPCHWLRRFDETDLHESVVRRTRHQVLTGEPVDECQRVRGTAEPSPARLLGWALVRRTGCEICGDKREAQQRGEYADTVTARDPLPRR